MRVTWANNLTGIATVHALSDECGNSWILMLAGPEVAVEHAACGIKRTVVIHGVRRACVDALATPLGATPTRLVDLAFELDVDGDRHEDDERPELVGIGGKNGQIYNMTTNDVVAILNWCIATTDYALGMLNDENVGHFRADDVVYYVKGVCYVVDNILEALLICDESIATRGGKENVDECQKRFNMISAFNPIYVVAGSYGVGDSFWPNHIAALARHVDVVNNRLSDIRHAMMN